MEPKRARLHSAFCAPVVARSAPSDSVAEESEEKLQLRSRAQCFLMELEAAAPDGFDGMIETLFEPAEQVVAGPGGVLVPVAVSHEERLHALGFCLETLQCARQAALQNAGLPDSSDDEEERPWLDVQRPSSPASVHTVLSPTSPWSNGGDVW
jgi:hypothetical protein